jgi:hypothetical protein
VHPKANGRADAGALSYPTEDIMGLFNAINPANVVTSVLTGGLSKISSLNLVSSFGQNLIQKLGDALHLPQPMIDAAQGAFASASGDPLGAATNAFQAGQGFAEAAGKSVTDSAEYGKQFEDFISQLAGDLAGGQEAKDAKSGGKGGSWLMAMARALGQKADKLADQMQNLADQMSAENSKPSDSALFGAKSQEFSLFMNAATNAIKTSGEALGTMARKG